MSGEEGIFIYENCDEQIAAGIRQFSLMKAGCSTASKRRSIWPQLGACLDEVVSRFAAEFKGWPSSTLFLEAKGVSRLGPYWRDGADRVIDQDYLHGKRLVRHSYRDDLLRFMKR